MRRNQGLLIWIILEDAKLYFRLGPKYIQISNGKYLTYLREEGDAIQEAKWRDNRVVQGGKVVQSPEPADRVTHLKAHPDLPVI
jgi:hypothetical protein